MNDLLEQKAKLLGSLLLFTQVFYKIRTGREFVISDPIARESHQITICRELTKVFRLETSRIIINIQPGAGKSELLIHFICWCMAHYPDCQFIYISYSHDLAAKHTYTIKQIIQLPAYRKIFGVEIKHDSSAKDNFKTLQGGAVKAFGSGGGITGQDAGLPNLARFSGAVIMDDMHKPDEVHSDTTRENVKRNYMETIIPRPRSPNVPMIFIGQRLHEDDLPNALIKKTDGCDWKTVILQSIDGAGNVLHPAVTTKSMLLNMQETNPYVFASQYQQDPIPAGGGIFRPEWFPLLDEEPNFMATFITADTAETDKSFNDATVFSFWGIYNIKQLNIETELLGLHWIDCYEMRVEPKDLEAEFIQFYADCMRHKTKPFAAVIEKKSTGVTLLSVLRGMQGLQAFNIERIKNKTDRFFSIQHHIASKYVSLPIYGKHTHMCLEHMRKITGNNTHRFDDIADTCYDAVKAGLIDKSIYYPSPANDKANAIVTQLATHYNQIQKARRRVS